MNELEKDFRRRLDELDRRQEELLRPKVPVETIVAIIILALLFVFGGVLGVVP